MPFQITRKALTLDHLAGQYCNQKNCVSCNASSLATAGLSCTTTNLVNKIHHIILSLQCVL